MKVAVFNDWPPDEFLSKSGALEGWSVDLANAMSTVLGVKFTFAPTSFEVILPGIQNGRYDAGFASFGITPDRLKVLDFIPEITVGSVFASLKSSNLNVTKIADVCGHSVAVLTGAFDYQELTKLSKTDCTTKGQQPIDLKQFTTQSAAELAVESGRVEMVYAGSTTLGYLTKQKSNMTTSSLVVDPVYDCIGVRKGDPLGKSLADALQKIIDTGAYKQIMDKWGLTNGLVSKGVVATASNPNPQAN